MEQMTFRTNIKCSGCVAFVKPNLDRVTGGGVWAVDTASPDKILIIDAPRVDESAILKAVQDPGYIIKRKA